MFWCGLGGERGKAAEKVAFVKETPDVNRLRMIYLFLLLKGMIGVTVKLNLRYGNYLTVQCTKEESVYHLFYFTPTLLSHLGSSRSTRVTFTSLVGVSPNFHRVAFIIIVIIVSQ